MFDLSGKCALVTGATGGIGQAIARHLLAQGATVVLTGTQQEVLDSLAAELGGNAHPLQADLSDPATLKELPKRAEDAMGRIDILVNNAGITRDNIAMRMSDEEWETVLDLNLTAGFKLARGVLRGMMKARWGRIIGISSVVGTTGNAGQANYAAAKAGMIGMTKSLAQEVAGRGITVNCVAPGFIETTMTDALGEEQRNALLDRIPAARLGATGDVASAVAYLASEEAGYVTGHTLHVNGGMAMV